MTKSEKLERLELIIKIKTKMKNMIFWYMMGAIGVFSWFLLQEYPNFFSYLPIGIVNLLFCGLMIYLYLEAKKSLHLSQSKYQEVLCGDEDKNY